MFADVLSYKAQADSMRNALTILQRYRFLFSLPRTIEANIKKVTPRMMGEALEKWEGLVGVLGQ